MDLSVKVPPPPSPTHTHTHTGSTVVKFLLSFNSLINKVVTSLFLVLYSFCYKQLNETAAILFAMCMLRFTTCPGWPGQVLWIFVSMELLLFPQLS